MRTTEIIEALLFASDAPLTAADLARADEDLDEDAVEQAILALRAEYDATGRAFQVYEIAGGYQLLTRPEYAGVLERFHTVPQSGRLSGPALEVLAIIAYRQPIGRTEIEEIRGIGSAGVLRTLQDRQLIDVVGRGEGLGRPLLYGTTQKFLEHFGFNSLHDLPRPDELPVVLKQRGPADAAPAAPEQEATSAARTASEQAAAPSANGAEQPEAAQVSPPPEPDQATEAPPDGPSAEAPAAEAPEASAAAARPAPEAAEAEAAPADPEPEAPETLEASAAIADLAPEGEAVASDPAPETSEVEAPAADSAPEAAEVTGPEAAAADSAPETQELEAAVADPAPEASSDAGPEVGSPEPPAAHAVPEPAEGGAAIPDDGAAPDREAIASNGAGQVHSQVQATAAEPGASAN